MRATYPYVGPQQLAVHMPSLVAGARIDSREDVRRWLRHTAQAANAAGEVTVTFVIDESGCLRIADRHSEHVACAGGRPVRSAGEMTFADEAQGLRVVWVTNQSTGYCPEPESWPAVQSALTRAGLEAPAAFSQAFPFRRCSCCCSINIIKDDVFECAVCAAVLPETWNLDAAAAAPQR